MVITVLIVALVALAPALVWLAFFLHEDVHPEPKKWLTIAFFGGALSCIPTFIFQWGAQEVLADVVGGAALLVLLYAFIEEALKLLTAYLVVRRNPAFDEPVDAMIYLVVASLGFATVENIFVMNGTASTLASVGTFFTAGVPLYTLSLRLAGATLLHALCSALVGYYWARGRAQSRLAEGARRATGVTARFVVFGLLAATLFHAFFNQLVSLFGDSTLIYPSLFLMVVGFFVLMDFERLKKIP